MNNNRKYSNGTITVVWQPAECIHAGVCFRSLRRVFDPTRRPWIDPSAAETEEIIDIVEQCPSRALTFFWNDPTQAIAGREHSPKLFDRNELNRLFPTAETQDKRPESAAGGTKIVFRPGSPLVVEGDFLILTEEGRAIGQGPGTVAFCRCGQSENQPFCDGAHLKIGFRR